MSVSRFLAAGLALAALAGCAKRPDTIEASFVSYEKFTGLNCERLFERMKEAKANLLAQSIEQDHAATNDAVTVFLVGVPLSALSGDHQGEVARLKGEVEAIETAQVKAKCRAP